MILASEKQGLKRFAFGLLLPHFDPELYMNKANELIMN